MFWKYQCCYCPFHSSVKKTVKNHTRTEHNATNLDVSFYKRCVKCLFTSENEVKIFRHYLIDHRRYIECVKCDRLSSSRTKYVYHLNKHHLSDVNFDECRDFCNQENIFNRVLIKRLNFDPYEEISIEYMLFLKYRKKIKEELKSVVRKYRYAKTMFITHCYFEKIDMEGNVLDDCVIPITSGCLQDIREFDLYHFKSFLNSMLQRTMANMEKIELLGSGLVMRYITNFDIRFCIPTLIGGCNKNPDYQQLKKFNIAEKYLSDFSNSDDNYCFLYAVAAAKVLQKTPLIASRPDEFRRETLIYYNLHFNNAIVKKRFKFPFHIKHCKRFENYFTKLQIAANIWTVCNGQLFTLYQSKQDWSISRIDIFLYQSHHEAAVGHYAAINNTNAFLRSVKQFCFSVRKSIIGRKTYYCDKCVSVFTSARLFRSHVYRCKNPNGQKIEYAEKGDKVVFDSTTRRQCKAAYIGFLDFEAKMTTVTNEQNFKRTKCENCRDGGPVRHCNHSERELSYQDPMTYSFYVFSSGGKLLFQKTYSSDQDVMEDFFKTLEACEEELAHMNNAYKTLHMSDRLQTLFEKEEVCWICKNEFVPGDKKYGAVPDHCHLTPPTFNKEECCLESKYLGAAHSICNLQRQSPNHIPVYVHNFMSYDSNFILKHLDVKEDASSIKCMPYNSNKLRTLTLQKWKFLDSYQMLSGSLADLVNNLSLDKTDFELVRQGLGISNENVKLCTKKAAYPYEWVNSVSQLKNAVAFPPYKCFYSTLKGDNISIQQYKEGKEIYEKFKFKNMLEYTEFYCKLDTLLLAEVMFSFRDTIYNTFELAIENFISLPQLSFDACLKTLDGKSIEKLHDPAMVTLLEQNIRGGVSFVNNRHEVIRDTDDECLLYIDANNLYGWAQKMFLPVGEYEWVRENQFSKLNWTRMTHNQAVGYIAEVDLEFPPDIHKKLDNLPLAPDHENIDYDKLSPYSKVIQENILGKKRAKRYKQSKLVTSLSTKKRYVIHYLNLKLYLSLGAKLTKVHNVIQFKQQDILKPFIEFASKMRAESKTKFATDLWKRLANSLYGKFIQDVRKYSNVHFVDDEKRLGYYINSVYFKDVSKISDDLCMVLMQNSSLVLDKLYGIGFTILELSKFFMYKTWYDFIQPEFGDSAELVVTDTDSFVIKFNNHSKAEALKKLSPIMDFSNFPKDSSFYNESKKKIPGYFKDEYPGGLIKEAVNVRSKCYFLDVQPDSNVSNPINKTSHVVCKGISQSVSSKFPLSLYKECIYSKHVQLYTTMHRIRSKKRQLCTTAITKQTLSSGDDKRYQTCAIHSLPYGSVYKKMFNRKCIKCLRRKIKGNCC